MTYIIILVDKLDGYTVGHQDDNMKIQYISKGQQMVGLRFRHTRPSLVIDTIKDRSYKNAEGDELFDKWFEQCVIPNTKNATYIRHT